LGGSSVHWTERSIASIVAGRWPSPHSPTGLHCCQRLPSGHRPGAHTEVCAALHGLGHRACGHRPRVGVAVPRRTSPPTFTGSCLPSTASPSRALETRQAPPTWMGDRHSSHGLSLRHPRVHSRPTRGWVFGTPEPTGISCSVLVVSLHLDGLLRVSSAGLLHPADGPGVRRVSPAEAGSPQRLRTLRSFTCRQPYPVTEAMPRRSAPSHPFTLGRCLLGVSSPLRDFPTRRLRGVCACRPPNRSAVALPPVRGRAGSGGAAPESAIELAARSEDPPAMLMRRKRLPPSLPFTRNGVSSVPIRSRPESLPGRSGDLPWRLTLSEDLVSHRASGPLRREPHSRCVRDPPRRAPFAVRPGPSEESPCTPAVRSVRRRLARPGASIHPRVSGPPVTVASSEDATAATPESLQAASQDPVQGLSTLDPAPHVPSTVPGKPGRVEPCRCAATDTTSAGLRRAKTAHDRRRG